MIRLINFKLLFLLNIIHFFFLSYSYSEIIKSFEISGNQRVTDETIIMFSNLEIGDNIDQNTLNKSLKELFYTDYFKDVKITFKNNIVNIVVDENPIIQTIAINGVKEKKIIEVIEEVTSKINKYPLIESKINDQVNLLKNILKS